MEKEKPLAMEILQDIMKQNRRMFVLSVIVISLLFGYIIYDRYKDGLTEDINATQNVSNNENTDINQDIK